MEPMTPIFICDTCTFRSPISLEWHSKDYFRKIGEPTDKCTGTLHAHLKLEDVLGVIRKHIENTTHFPSGHLALDIANLRELQILEAELKEGK